MRESEIQKRIETKGIKAEDIKYHGRLSDEQILSISVESAYMWIRTGEWKCKDFKNWLSLR
ncbi:hypothetical protein M0R04_04520 [Candidatus Dojkabacteria bacterium]|jgi:hypothetical protein|nr:hypothetical protein [Candidatus Dojkabacteria bacterium]